MVQVWPLYGNLVLWMKGDGSPIPETYTVDTAVLVSVRCAHHVCLGAGSTFVITTKYVTTLLFQITAVVGEK